MTPKEKAEQLLYAYSTAVLIDSYEAKLCALIAVDMIIQAMDNVILPNPFKQYWNKVKQEIQAQ